MPPTTLNSEEPVIWYWRYWVPFLALVMFPVFVSLLCGLFWGLGFV